MRVPSPAPQTAVSAATTGSRPTLTCQAETASAAARSRWARQATGRSRPSPTRCHRSGNGLCARGVCSSWMDFEQVDERQSEDSGRDDHGDGPVDAGTQCHDSVGSHSSERGLPVPLMSVDPFAIDISIPSVVDKTIGCGRPAPKRPQPIDPELLERHRVDPKVRGCRTPRSTCWLLLNPRRNSACPGLSKAADPPRDRPCLRNLRRYRGCGRG